MSPVSRRRKGAKSRGSGQRVLRSVPPPPPEPCDCPACTGEELDPQDMIDSLVAGAAEVLTVDDPLEAELFGATFLAAGDLAGEGFDEALAEGIVPAVAEAGTAESLALLIALDAVGDVPAAAAAARGLAGAGVPEPAWAAELREPVRVGACRRFADTDETTSMLVCSFDRSGRSHGFVLQADHTDCDAAVDILLVPGEALDEVVDTMRAEGRRAGVKVTEEALDPGEFRWQAERALDARAVHDQEDGPDLDDEDDEDGPGYPTVAVLLRARLRTLPEPPRPPAPHGDGGGRPAVPTLTRVGKPARLPAKRTKAGPAAPIYQIKVSLQGARPPIWRRLEVPADTSLAGLHAIIQVAFGWEDSHMHVFETAYGDFGRADKELGHQAEGPVALEQVAAGAGDKLRYTYDFGDDWTHEIVVEKVLDRQPVAYPRCTGGRRAAPPDDCGGIWGYADLVEVLADPDHPEHEDRLEWLGLESAAEFQPDRFDAAEITRALTR